MVFNIYITGCMQEYRIILIPKEDIKCINIGVCVMLIHPYIFKPVNISFLIISHLCKVIKPLKCERLLILKEYEEKEKTLLRRESNK